jgi:hypothetical protein
VGEAPGDLVAEGSISNRPRWASHGGISAGTPAEREGTSLAEWLFRSIPAPFRPREPDRSGWYEIAAFNATNLVTARLKDNDRHPLQSAYQWLKYAGLDRSAYDAHATRRTKAAQIYKNR